MANQNVTRELTNPRVEWLVGTNATYREPGRVIVDGFDTGITMRLKNTHTANVMRGRGGSLMKELTSTPDVTSTNIDTPFVSTRTITYPDGATSTICTVIGLVAHKHPGTTPRGRFKTVICLVDELREVLRHVWGIIPLEGVDGDTRR
jgi:hypothetical protein